MSIIKINKELIENEEIVFWLTNMLNNEIEEAKGAASNEHLFALGSYDDEATQHERYSEMNLKYVAILEDAVAQLNK
jgi:hypothetical protein